MLPERRRQLLKHLSSPLLDLVENGCPGIMCRTCDRYSLGSVFSTVVVDFPRVHCLTAWHTAMQGLPGLVAASDMAQVLLWADAVKPYTISPSVGGVDDRLGRSLKSALRRTGLGLKELGSTRLDILPRRRLGEGSNVPRNLLR